MAGTRFISSGLVPGQDNGVATADGGWRHGGVEYVLAQVNVARLRAPLDSPLLADFGAVAAGSSR
ncbi:MAG TPA: hypothetical protein VMA97_05505 [Streptosporangiaceae bacterium]|nr:hypothetical protein [Streptosporangiaceae bacterium]